MAIAPVLKNALIYTTANVANAAVPFLLLPVLTRVLSPEEYGVIAMFTASVLVLGAFTGLNVHAGIAVRYFDRGARDISRYIGSCLSIIAASTLAVLAIVWFFRAPLAAFTSVPEGWMIAAVIVAAMNAIVQVRLSLWMAREKAVAYGAFQVGRTVLDFGLSVYLVVILLEGVDGRLGSYAAAAAAFAALAIITLARNRGNFRATREGVRDALAFGAPLVPHMIGLFLVTAGDRFIINTRLGVDAAGVYTVAAQIGLGMALVMDAFNRAFVPWLYGHLRDGDPAMLRRIVARTWAGFAALLLFAGAVALLAEWVVGIFAGRAFGAAAAPLAWIAFGYAFHGMYLLVTNYTFYARKTAHLSVVTLASGAVALALAWWLVGALGIIGAGIAFAVAMLLKFLLTWALSQRVYPMPWFALFTPRGARP